MQVPVGEAMIGRVVDALAVDALSAGLAELCVLGQQPAARAAARAAVAELSLGAMAGRLLAVYRGLG